MNNILPLESSATKACVDVFTGEVIVAVMSKRMFVPSMPFAFCASEATVRITVPVCAQAAGTEASVKHLKVKAINNIIGQCTTFGPDMHPPIIRGCQNDNESYQDGDCDLGRRMLPPAAVSCRLQES